mmetsp:Transcript_6818/g.22424  ORF Transcript_6818/g.22424 Transcript_6818/m.22424 type:complete len:215 (+) Transcript_6818:1930-2574(+)
MRECVHLRRLRPSLSTSTDPHPRRRPRARLSRAPRAPEAARNPSTPLSPPTMRSPQRTHHHLVSPHPLARAIPPHRARCTTAPRRPRSRSPAPLAPSPAPNRAPHTPVQASASLRTASQTSHQRPRTLARALARLASPPRTAPPPPPSCAPVSPRSSRARSPRSPRRTPANTRARAREVDHHLVPRALASPRTRRAGITARTPWNPWRMRRGAD